MLGHRLAGIGRRSLFRSAAAAVALTAASLGVLTGCTTPAPLSIAATGDSITRGFDACGLFSDCPSVSYATGNDPSSTSIYERLLPADPRLAGHNYNDAQVGARAEDLYGQMGMAIWQKADVVTVLIGANDACTNSVAQMTSVTNFRGAIQNAFGLFFSNRPGARVVLSSIPDVYRVWQVAHTNASARAIWHAAGICPSMLANPTSTAPADNLRRFFVSLQIQRYNSVLASVCREYGGCRWDGGALARYPFTLSQLSSFDYFHPDAAGHRAMSGLAWKTYVG